MHRHRQASATTLPNRQRGLGDAQAFLSLAELEQSNLIAQLTVPDVDLLDADGNFNPRDDGVLDSIAIGLAFTSVGATFTAPADPDVDQ